VALPLLVAYVCATTAPKRPKRLYDRGEELRARLVEAYLANNREVGELKKLMGLLDA
jgi:hypothetical protein